MSTLTTKLLLTKPDVIENVDIAVLNTNFDLIDAAFAGIVGSFRNALRNGDMGVAQRGGGPFTANGVYTADGWFKGNVGGTHTVNQSPTTMGAFTGINNAKFHLNNIVAGQAAVGDYALLSHRIEDVRKFASKQVTLSFMAETGTSGSKIGIEIVQEFGTGGAPSAQLLTTVGAITVTATGVYQITFTVPNIVGKTIGTTGDYLGVNFWVSAGATFATRASAIGIQNATFNITDVQLEAGSVATAFERLPQQVQLAWCQRYFWRAQGNGALITGQMINTTRGFFPLPLPVFMRVAPTWTTFTLGSVYTPAGVGQAISSAGNYINANTAIILDINLASASWTAGQAAILFNGQYDVTAEL